MSIECALSYLTNLVPGGAIDHLVGAPTRSNLLGSNYHCMCRMCRYKDLEGLHTQYLRALGEVFWGLLGLHPDFLQTSFLSLLLGTMRV